MKLVGFFMIEKDVLEIKRIAYLDENYATERKH